MRRREIYNKIFSSGALFIAGLAVMPALLFNPSTPMRVLQFLFFWFLVFLSGKKNKPVFTILTIAGIVAFNLIIPYGRILFSLGPLKITEGALWAGIHRAATFAGLIMLSKVCIREDLKIPGTFGELLGESLRIFSVLTDSKQRIRANNFIADIDKLMLDLSVVNVSVYSPQKQKTTIVGFVILALVVFLSWLPWLNVLYA